MIYVNGSEQPDAPTLASLLERLGVSEQARGIAIALDGQVVPRSQWPSATLAPGTRVEVVGAIQGG